VYVTPITHAAWRDKPTFAALATDDKSIDPGIQHAMYKRSNTKVTEVKGSHVIFMSQPDAVAKVIVEAANNIKLTILQWATDKKSACVKSNADFAFGSFLILRNCG